MSERTTGFMALLSTDAERLVNEDIRGKEGDLPLRPKEGYALFS